MGVVFFLRNAVAIGVATAALVYIARVVARHVSRTLGKMADYHDVEKLDEAEILARKYDRERRKK